MLDALGKYQAEYSTMGSILVKKHSTFCSLCLIRTISNILWNSLIYEWSLADTFLHPIKTADAGRCYVTYAAGHGGSSPFLLLTSTCWIKKPQNNNWCHRQKPKTVLKFETTSYKMSNFKFARPESVNRANMMQWRRVSFTRQPKQQGSTPSHSCLIRDTGSKLLTVINRYKRCPVQHKQDGEPAATVSPLFANDGQLTSYFDTFTLRPALCTPSFKPSRRQKHPTTSVLESSP